MFGRLFRRSRPIDDGRAGWWATADAAALAPRAETIDAAAALMVTALEAPDEYEMQLEMIEGLRQLAAIADSQELPVVDTQHRVIGGDRCHFMAPVSLSGGAESGGKLFLTDRRAVCASGGTPRAWAWHRIRRIERERHDVHLIAGEADAVTLRFNTFGDALTAIHIARRLMHVP